MKIITILILIILSLNSFCQRQGMEEYYTQKMESIRIGDSLELNLSSNRSLANFTDTVNNFPLDESNGWRNNEYITYYFNERNLLEKIEIFSRQGLINFYFKDELIRKIRVYSFDSLVNSQYYFYEKDNNYSKMEINKLVQKDPLRRASYDLLIMARKLYLNFQGRRP